MGTRLIFLGQEDVTDREACRPLSDWGGSSAVPGNSPPSLTVPETDTGGLVEHTEALERTALKELGKLPP
jgi:hypothetical protein